MAKGEKIFVQLRLSEEEERDLRKAGEAQGRKLPAEIMQRLKASLTGAEPAIDVALYGWTAESLTRNRALGQAVGYLAAQIERVAGQSGDQQRDRATTLATVKLAVPVLLDLLGAKNNYLTSYHRSTAKAYAKNLFNDLRKAVEPPVAAGDLKPEAEALARIARGLDVPIHEWAKKPGEP